MYLTSPILVPLRRCATWGERVIFSCPPAATISASPSWMCCAAKATARNPDPQTWLMLHAADSIGRPALIWAWRAGFWPWPAVRTWPRMVSLTSEGSMPARSTIAFKTDVPRESAGVLAKAPPKLPTAVRAADTITIFVTKFLLIDEVNLRHRNPSLCAVWSSFPRVCMYYLTH